MNSARRTLSEVGTSMEMLKARYTQVGHRKVGPIPIPERLQNYLDVCLTSSCIRNDFISSHIKIRISSNFRGKNYKQYLS